MVRHTTTRTTIITMRVVRIMADSMAADIMAVEIAVAAADIIDLVVSRRPNS